MSEKPLNLPTAEALQIRAANLLERYRNAGLMIVTAESCTGGLVAGLLTEIPGSSSVVERGFVTYSNEAKNECIGVPMDLIIAHGAVSAQVAAAMAEGALRHSHAHISVAITGVAGPGGGSPEKPVGLVQFATAKKGGQTINREMRYGDPGRGAIRQLAVATALDLLESWVE